VNDNEKRKLIEIAQQLHELGDEPTLSLAFRLRELREQKLIYPAKSCQNCESQNECGIRKKTVELAQMTRDSHAYGDQSGLHSDLFSLVAINCKNHSAIDDPVFTQR
jgi:hypothetical protein